MANTPATTRRLSPANLALGPKLIGVAIALFITTRIIIWLPLGLLGTWINGILWPILLLALVVGAGMTYAKATRAKRAHR